MRLPHPAGKARSGFFLWALAAGLAGALPAQAQTAAAPATPAASTGAVELEFWRSAERQGTAEAYRAYLAAFPEGTFAPLARAALGRAAGPAPAAAAPASAAGLPPASPSLRHFSAPATQTGAVTFNLGDRFNGPGVLSLGWAGAKRQLVLPPGEWVVLAASDVKADITPPAYRFPTRVVMDIGHIVLGRFSGTRLAAAMVYQSSIRPGAVDDWPDLAGCQGGGGALGLHLANTRPSPMRSECTAVIAVAAPLAAKTRPMDEARASLERLGAQVQGDAIASVVMLAEPRNGFLSATRLDWPGLKFGAAADDAAGWSKAATAAGERAAYVARLVDWVGHYRALVAEGYRFRLEQPELKAGARAQAGSDWLRDL